MSDMHDHQTLNASPQASPGELLHREREAMGLSLEEVATGLNLRPAVVRGLENDSYEEVPIAAYRRGYLRAYARLLGVDENSIINVYNQRFGQAETPSRARHAPVSLPSPRLGGRVYRLATLLVVLAVVASAILWWQTREQAPLEAIDANEPVAVDTLDGSTAVVDGETSPDEERSSEAIASPATDTSTPDVATASLQPDNDILEAGDGGTVVSSDSDVEDDSAVAQTEALPANEETTDASPPPATSDDRILRFTFSKESWTEVTDASGRRIFASLQAPGTQTSVEGEPPFRLTIGNADGVELRYRGETVDLTSIAGGSNVARFTLGE